MVQILPVQSRQAITRAEMVPFLLFFPQSQLPLYFWKEKFKSANRVFLEEKIYLRSKFPQAIQR